MARRRAKRFESVNGPALATMPNHAFVHYENFAVVPPLETTTDHPFQITDTNATDSGTYAPDATCPLKLTTGGTSGDDVILFPTTTHVMGAGLFATDNVRVDWTAAVSGTITSAMEAVAGIGHELGVPGVLTTNDQDRVGIVYNPTNSANWRFFITRDGVQTYVDTGMPAVVDDFHTFGVQVVNGILTFFLDGTPIRPSTQMRTLKDNGSTPVEASPVASVTTTTTGVRVLKIRGLRVVKLWP